MPNRIETAKVTLGHITASGANYVIATGSAIGIGQQLNQSHEFLYLHLPLWLFLLATLFLALIGSLGSLYIDTIRESKLSMGQKIINLGLGFMVGAISAFVILPAFTAKPPVWLILITALIMSFIGVVLVRNIGDLVRSEELWSAAKEVCREVLIFLKDLLIERFKIFISLFLGGRGK